MRNLAGCFAHHAVRVAENACLADAKLSIAERPTQNAIACLYRITLSTGKELLTRLTWSRNHTGASLSVKVESGTTSNTSKMRSHVLRKKKGSRCFLAGDSFVSLHWDVSAASYGSGPEPTKGFYLVAVADAELGLLLGDMCAEFVRRTFEGAAPPPVAAECSAMSRMERVRRGVSAYATKAALGGGGREQRIVISCKGNGTSGEGSELSISVDEKKVVDVQRLEWNFRGNQAIVVDGSTVDVMWDVHGWWFGDPSGCSLFMFRQRRTPEMESSLRLDEELEKGVSAFSLLIQAI